jgi:hypothetical protein
MGHLQIRPALFLRSLVQQVTDRRIRSLRTSPANLYEFFMDFLDQFYAPPFSMNDSPGIETESGLREDKKRCLALGLRVLVGRNLRAGGRGAAFVLHQLRLQLTLATRAG